MNALEVFHLHGINTTLENDIGCSQRATRPIIVNRGVFQWSKLSKEFLHSRYIWD